jgi:large subunit ribosomal protein L37Ae
MAEVKKLGSVKRFGARYGRSLKHKFAQIEVVQRAKHKCPYCSAVAVKRVATGIWKCRRCDAKFTGKAYSIKEAITFEEEKPKQEVKETEMEEEEESETYKDKKQEEEKEEEA